MVNRRIISFGLIVVLGLAVLTMGKNYKAKKMLSKDNEIQMVRSDEDIIVETEEDGLRKTVMYFKNGDGYLVPVMRRIPWEEGIAKVTLNNMVDSPELRETLSLTGLAPIIPAGTEVIGMTIDENTGICKVDFSEHVVDMDSQKEEEDFIKGVIYTLTEFSAINEVQILVGGNTLSTLQHGSNISEPMARADINLLGNMEEGRSKVTVYYKSMADDELEYFIPVTVPTLAPIANVYSALDILFEGPPESSGLYSDIPKDITLHGVEIKNGTAYVDISYDDFVVDSNDLIFTDVMKNIGLTLGQFEEIETVELLIDGEIINTAIPVFANEY